MKREVIEKLLNWKEKTQRFPLLIYGARQIGKTYILKEFAKKNFTKFYYLNFEEDSKLGNFFSDDLKPQRIIRDLSLYLEKEIDIKNDFVIFDEIQACPKALTSLKYFAEKMPELHLAAAGSLLGLELNSESFPVGKVEQIHMYPMRFMEFLLALDDELYYNLLKNFDSKDTISNPVHEKLLNRLKEYFVVGGMPSVVKIFVEQYQNLNYEIFELVREEQSRIIESVLADIAKHSGKENSMNISKTWQYMPSKLDGDYDGTSSRFHFKEVIPGKKRYQDFIGILDWLEKASLVIRVHQIDHVSIPLATSLKENFFKLYNYDIGILARLCNLSPKRILANDYGRFKGFFVENFVAQELRYLVNFLDPILSWKKKDWEIEFLISDSDGYALPIEVKAGQAKNLQSLKKFTESYEVKTKIILSSDEIKINPDTQVYKLPLYIPLDKFI